MSDPSSSSSTSSTQSQNDEWASLRPLVSRRGPWCTGEFQPEEEDPIDVVQNSTRVLVVGAGGLGCEILKDLALSGFSDIHVIDLDTVDVSNLNRQFLFRMSDVNKYKAEVAAKFVMNRCPGVQVTAHMKPIQEFSPKWYKQFDIVIAGLDNIEARQFLNSTLVNLVEFDPATGEVDPDTVIPLIDGGTEGFAGQARVFLPRITSCYECSLASMPPQTGFAVCTIRNVPRIPEHAIVYALKMEWPLLTAFTNSDDYTMAQRKEDGGDGPTGGDDDDAPSNHGVPLDKDNVDHMTWIYKRACERAQKFGITGVTYNLTMQVVKNIIPAIASTNALISAACVGEALKFRTGCGPTLNNYYMYIGGSQTGINTETIVYQRNPACPVCSPPTFMTVDPVMTLDELLKEIEVSKKLEKPSLMVNGTFLYLAPLHTQYADNLTKCIGELLESGQMCVINDKTQKTVKVIVNFAG